MYKPFGINIFPQLNSIMVSNDRFAWNPTHHTGDWNEGTDPDTKARLR